MSDEATTTTDLVKAAAEGGLTGFLTTIAAPLVESGEWGADLVRRYRVKTQIKTLVRANELLEQAGLPPNAVSLKVLIPLLGTRP